MSVSHEALDRSEQAEAAEALARHDWGSAYQLLRPLAEGDGEDAGVLAALAESAWWLGRLDECIEARQRAYALCEAAGDRRRAARLAARLFDDHCFGGRRIVAQTWVRRASRLLVGEGDCVERGVLLLREVEILASGSAPAARDRAEQALELGRDLGDADLEAESLQALGRLLIGEGRVVEGLECCDEAMLLASQGGLDPFVTGKVYCSLISACEELGELQRAAEWTEVGARWSAAHPLAVFPGLCRVHRAALLRLRGEWDQAEREARAACDELSGLNLANAARAFYEIGEVRRRLGDLETAEEAYRRVAELGGRNQPGLALLRLGQGRVVAAAAGIAQALADEVSNRLSRAPLLAAHVEIAVAAGDLDAAREAVTELEGIAAEFAGPMLRAAAWTARGRVELAGGDAPAACRTLRRALTEWQSLAVAHEVVTTRLLLGGACREAGDEEAATVCFETATADAARLGIDRRGAGSAPAGRDVPGGLTGREAQVLRLVASGATNKDIAATLGLSQKTVARHLSNIFVKIGVSSRVAATAYAFEQGLMRPTGTS